MRIHGILFMSLLSGCHACSTNDGAAPDAGVDAAPAPIDAAPDVEAAPAPSASATASAPSPQCRLALRVTSLRSSGGITDPDLQSGSTSTLVFPCSGGAARAQFGKHVFVGTADKSHVSLSAGSTYNALGCPWHTTQTISGTPPSLVYSYTEKVVPPCKSSARPSTMSGAISAQ
jgi:hypothetical protein